MPKNAKNDFELRKIISKYSVLKTLTNYESSLCTKIIIDSFPPPNKLHFIEASTSYKAPPSVAGTGTVYERKNFNVHR
jgi:hypothetical protein